MFERNFSAHKNLEVAQKNFEGTAPECPPMVTGLISRKQKCSCYCAFFSFILYPVCPLYLRMILLLRLIEKGRRMWGQRAITNQQPEIKHSCFSCQRGRSAAGEQEHVVAKSKFVDLRNGFDVHEFRSGHKQRRKRQDSDVIDEASLVLRRWHFTLFSHFLLVPLQQVTLVDVNAELRNVCKVGFGRCCGKYLICWTANFF